MATYIPPERIASQLREAPFYLEMDFYVMVENIFKALREMRMITLERRFETFNITDNKVFLKPHYAIFNVVRLQDTYTPYVDGVYQPNQLVFTVPEDEDSQIKTDQEAIDDIKRVTPHIIGEYINYNQEGNCLVFNETDINIGIEYNTIGVDKNGYPLIPDQAEEAVVYYVAWIHYLGEFMATRLDGQRMQYFEQLKERKMREARLDHRLSQNQIDKLLNTVTSFDRKAYGWTA